MDPLVIVGASLAGARAARAARMAGYEGKLVMIGAEPHLPYTRPPLSKEILAGTKDASSCRIDIDDCEVDWRLGEPASGLDLDARQVALAGGETISFERLVIATGCRARRWVGAGGELRGVHVLRDLDHATGLAAALADGRRLVILGAGFLGCEAAASARSRGAAVTLVDTAPLPMPGVGDALGRRCAEMHHAHGVELQLGIGVVAIHGDEEGAVEAVELANGARLPADLVLVAIGAIPNTEWLAGSGLTLDPGVVCDAHLAAVGSAGVFCCGDVAAWPHPLAAGELVRLEHWTNAAEQGAVAGRNAVVAPADRVAYEAVPSFWSDQYDAKFQAVGLPRRARRMEVAETGPDGERFIVLGCDDRGRPVAALAFNGGRRLPWYRRMLDGGADRKAILAAVEADPKSFAGAAVVS
ncbi:MAG: FAD-dependent oxidoreductase [Actinobacteria bacterium]|nr:FAD-dependent oxidoreductase [Actinomycetota bacterium]